LSILLFPDCVFVAQTRQQSELSASLSSRLTALESSSAERLPALQSQLDSARSQLDSLTEQHAAFLARHQSDQQRDSDALQQHLHELSARLANQQTVTEQLARDLTALAEKQRNDWLVALQAGLAAPLDSELKAMVENVMQGERERLRQMLEDEVGASVCNLTTFNLYIKLWVGLSPLCDVSNFCLLCIAST
jgi:predicted RNase H-like nuclease (RuvC/YqgF family)